MSGRITIKSIARDLGISHMTVSRALSNHPNVQESTREMIVKRARELGYVKNAAATAMRGDGTRIVGLLLPNIVNDFYARFANVMADVCAAQSLHLVIHLTNDDLGQEQQALDRLRELQAMAVVMVPSPGAPGGTPPDMTPMSVIELVRRREGSGAQAAVLVDDHDALRDAVLHLADKGHRAIGYIGASGDLSSGGNRLSAYREGLRQAGLPEDPALVHTDAPSFGMGRKSAEHLLAAGKATGIVCGGVEISNGALSALMHQGLKPGRDFAFVGYGDPHWYAWVAEGITAVRLPVEDLAREVVALLGRDHLQSRETRSFKATLVIR